MNIENYKVVMPEHLNHYGYIFGGNLLKWVDEYSWIAATLEFPDCNLVTASMDKVEYRKNVRQGNILKFCIENIKKGHSYVKYKVKVFCIEKNPDHNEELIFNTVVTLVNIGENGKIASLIKK